MSPFRIAAVYISLEAAMTTLWMIPVLVLTPGELPMFKEALLQRRGDSLWMGIAMYVTYFLVLTAITISPNVGYVVALRQLSLPFVAFAGVVLFKETLSLQAVLGLVLIVFGLIGVAL